MIVEKIVSGGQTGVDRAALDVALAADYQCGGWCPKGRRAMDGRIPARYPLRETESADYRERTEWNVRDSDATLVLTRKPLRGGTAYTVLLAKRMAKPHVIVDLTSPTDPAKIRAWLLAHHVHTLNVAGPREQSAPGIYAAAVAYLEELLIEAGTVR